MMNDGQVVFGVWNNATKTVESKNVYNDGQWHYVVATLDPTAGMSLYIDNQLVGTNVNTVAQNFTGFWRVGGDNLNGWNLDPWGSSSQGLTQPGSYYFNGTMADVAVYPSVLSAAQIAAHYAAGVFQQ
jgi:trimeric autotransporter adhesin